jgi:hypothetical protein
MDKKEEESRIDTTKAVPGDKETIAGAIIIDPNFKHSIDSLSSDHSSGIAAPSITSATSAGYSDSDEVMSEEWCERDVVQSLDFLVGQPSNIDSTRMEVDASILTKHSDDDGSFYSILHGHWGSTSQAGDDHEYASDYTDDSRDSFGPLKPKYGRGSFRTDDSYDYDNHSIGRPGCHNGLKLRNVHHMSKNDCCRVGHEIHIDSRRCREQMNREADMMINSSLSVSCSSDSDKVEKKNVDLLHSPCSAKSKSFHSVISTHDEPPQSPIPLYIQRKSRQARAAIKKRKDQARLAFLKHKEAYRSYRVRRRAARQQRQQKSRIIVIPSNHKLKILWDMATIGLTFVSAYVGHIYIRDRSTYEWDWFVIFTNIWFVIDLLLNFFTEHRTSDGTVMKTGREVWGRYLTTWFAIDALSLLPWERMFLRPIIQKQKRRNFVVKWFFRSKAVVKVTVGIAMHHES